MYAYNKQHIFFTQRSKFLKPKALCVHEYMSFVLICLLFTSLSNKIISWRLPRFRWSHKNTSHSISEKLSDKLRRSFNDTIYLHFLWSSVTSVSTWLFRTLHTVARELDSLFAYLPTDLVTIWWKFYGPAIAQSKLAPKVTQRIPGVLAARRSSDDDRSASAPVSRQRTSWFARLIFD